MIILILFSNQTIQQKVRQNLENFHILLLKKAKKKLQTRNKKEGVVSNVLCTCGEFHFFYYYSIKHRHRRESDEDDGEIRYHAAIEYKKTIFYYTDLGNWN